jgi:hypothetical protein
LLRFSAGMPDKNQVFHDSESTEKCLFFANAFEEK